MTVFCTAVAVLSYATIICYAVWNEVAIIYTPLQNFVFALYMINTVKGLQVYKFYTLLLGFLILTFYLLPGNYFLRINYSIYRFNIFLFCEKINPFPSPPTHTCMFSQLSISHNTVGIIMHFLFFT